MDDAGGVGGGEGAGDLDTVFEDFGEREAAAGDEGVEGLAFDLLHRDEVSGVVGGDVVDGDDVGVIEGGGLGRRRSVYRRGGV